MTELWIALGLYVLVLPLTIFALAKLHKLFFITLPMRRVHKKRAKNKPHQKIDMDSLPRPLTPRITKRLKFTMKDKRGISFKKGKQSSLQTRFVFLGLYLAGLIVAAIAPYTAVLTMALASVTLAIIALAFGAQSANKAIKKREEITKRIAEMAGRRFKISQKPGDPPEKVARIDRWVDYTKPEYVRIFSPTGFSDTGQEEFVREFNKTYGQVRSWVPDPDVEGAEGGWDHETGVLYLKSKPPLPKKAAWHPDYVLGDGIAWSFFPLAIGIEDGVEMTNPETGETVNVLGFDVAGEQKDVGPQAGLAVSKSIGTTPQVFIGGGTGGGKAHPLDTKVVVLNG